MSDTADRRERAALDAIAAIGWCWVGGDDPNHGGMVEITGKATALTAVKDLAAALRADTERPKKPCGICGGIHVEYPRKDAEPDTERPRCSYCGDDWTYEPGSGGPTRCPKCNHEGGGEPDSERPARVKDMDFDFEWSEEDGDHVVRLTGPDVPDALRCLVVGDADKTRAALDLCEALVMAYDIAEEALAVPRYTVAEIQRRLTLACAETKHSNAEHARILWLLEVAFPPDSETSDG